MKTETRLADLVGLRRRVRRALTGSLPPCFRLAALDGIFVNASSLRRDRGKADLQECELSPVRPSTTVKAGWEWWAGPHDRGLLLEDRELQGRAR